MDKMHERAYQSGDFYRDGKFDEQAARKHYEEMAVLRKQMFENSLEQRKRIDSILAPEQRQQWQRGLSGGRQEDDRMDHARPAIAPFRHAGIKQEITQQRWSSPVWPSRTS